MKNKFGFTLAELLGVMVIISLLMIITIPPIINQIKANSLKISEAATEILNAATDEYLKANESVYPIVDNMTYCITLQQLVDADLIAEPFIDLINNVEIPLNRFNKVSAVEKYNITYTLVETCP